MARSNRTQSRSFVRTVLPTPAAEQRDSDSAKKLNTAVSLRGMQAPDVWVPDNEDGTAPGLRATGLQNLVEVIAAEGSEFPGEIHPRIPWHRDVPEMRDSGFCHLRELADPENGALDHIDGFVIPEVGAIDDWNKAAELLSLVEAEYELGAGRLSMSVVVESSQAEQAITDLQEELPKPTNTLERLYMLVVGGADYTKDMGAITPTGSLPEWDALQHSVARGASLAGAFGIGGAYLATKDIDGYRDRITANQATGLLGIWALTPTQVTEANRETLPPASGHWRIETPESDVALRSADDTQVYEGNYFALEEQGDSYVFAAGAEGQRLTGAELRAELQKVVSYVPSLADIVDSIEAFEQERDAGRGANTVTRSARVRIDDVEVDIELTRMWDEAVYQTRMTPVRLFQDVYQNRPDQHDELAEMYGESVIQRANAIGT
jgi:bifunctional (S)-malyl-CoA lyase/thioesterase